MNVVPDEWLVECLAGSLEYQRLASHFLDDFESAGDVLAIRRTSPFATKLQRALRELPSRRLWLMLYDSARVRLVDDDEIVEPPDDLLANVAGDDVYLVEVAYAVRPCILVTTDGGLLEALEGKDPQLLLRRPQDMYAAP